MSMLIFLTDCHITEEILYFQLFLLKEKDISNLQSTFNVINKY